MKKGRLGAAGKTISDPTVKVAELTDAGKQELERLHPEDSQPSMRAKGPGLEVTIAKVHRALENTKRDS